MRKTMKRTGWRCSAAIIGVIVLLAGIFLFPRLPGEQEKDLRQELLSLYREFPDGYDRQSIGLIDCPPETAREIAARVGGVLQMDERLGYGTILLPESCDAERAIGRLDEQYLSCLSPSAILYPATVPFDDTFAGFEEELSLSLMNPGDTWKLTAGKTETKRVKIAVVDSGIDYTHPELAGRISEESYSVPLGKTVKETGDWSILDATGTPHGTKVSSIIMAAANNAQGIAGIAYDCEFVFIKLTDTGGTFRSDEMMAGISYAASIGCDVVNLSLGAAVTIPGCDTVINAANASGCVVVCAAGNDTSDKPHYPSSCAGAISVGALESWNHVYNSTYESYTTIAYYSNFGDGQVDVVAPGTWLTATDSRFAERNPNASSADINAKSRYSNEWYNTGKGTSLASPAVAAVIGLYRSVHPEAGPAAVKAALLASCRDLGDTGVDDYYGYGLIDMERFVCGETVRITYSFGEGLDSATALAAKGGRINSLPTLPSAGARYFAGWYADAECTIPVEPLGTVAEGNMTFYAGWCDSEADAALFDLRLVDPTLRMIALMQACGDGNAYSTLAKTATRIALSFPDPRSYSENRDAIRELVKTTQSEKMADLVTDTLCAKTAAYTIYGYRGRSAELTLPAEVDGIPVTGIASRAFSGRSLTHITLPEGLEAIGAGAFRRCSALSWMQLPTTVQEIGSGAFEGTSLDLTTLLEQEQDGWSRLYYHYRGAHRNNQKTYEWFGGSGTVTYSTLRTVADGFELLTQGEDGYTLLRYSGDSPEPTLGAWNGRRLTSIADGAFRNNGALARVTLPASVEAIGESAFEGCTALETVRFEGETLTLGKAAFKGCTALGSIRIPAGLAVLPESCFEGCTALWQVTFPADSRLTELGSSAFADCVSLSRVSLLTCTGLQKLGAAFRGCASLRFLAVPKVESISAGALRDCKALEWLELPFAGGSATLSSQGYLGYLFGATDREDSSCLPDALRVLVLTGRSAGGAGMMTGLSGATVFLGDTATATLRASLPEGNTYYFRGEWSAKQAVWSDALWMNLPTLAGSPAFAADRLLLPVGYKPTGILPTDTGYSLVGEACTYRVVFRDAAGAVLSEQDGLQPGDPLEYPAKPENYTDERAAYIFEGWSHSTLRATDDLTIVPRFTILLRLYMITIKDRESGRVLLTKQLVYGDSVPAVASYEEDGYRYDFRFDAGENLTVTGDAEYTGYFEKTALTYTVTFRDGETVLAEGTYRYGESLTPPTAPSRDPDERYVYRFAGWSPAVAATVTGNASYEATWQKETRLYLVIFLDDDGTELARQEYEYGAAVQAPANPADRTHDGTVDRFAGWTPDPAGKTVTGDMTFRAAYRTETVTEPPTEPPTQPATEPGTDVPATPATGTDPAGEKPGTGTDEPGGTDAGCASDIRMGQTFLWIGLAAFAVAISKRQKAKERRK